MSDFFAKLHKALEESHRQKDLQKAADTDRQIRFIENVVTTISTRLHIASELIVVLSHDTDNNSLFFQIDGVFFRIWQSKKDSSRKFETSSYSLYLTNFSIANDFKWKDDFICRLSNLDIEILAEEVFSLFNLKQLVQITADTQAYYDSSDGRVLVDRVLMSEFEVDSVIRLRELNKHISSKFRWVYQVGNRVVAYYYQDFKTHNHMDNNYKGNITLLGYSFIVKREERVCVETRVYSFSQSNIHESISATVESDKNTVFAAAEVMQVLGLEPIVAETKANALTETI